MNKLTINEQFISGKVTHYLALCIMKKYKVKDMCYNIFLFVNKIRLSYVTKVGS